MNMDTNTLRPKTHSSGRIGLVIAGLILVGLALPVSGQPLSAHLKPVPADEAGRVYGGGITADNDNRHAGSDELADGGDGDDSRIGGVATYRLTSMVVGVNIQDKPLGYAPPVGPAVVFRLSYNQRESSQPANPTFGNVGPNWTHDWLTYIEDDPKAAGNRVARIVPGGGKRVYEDYDPERKTFKTEERDGAVLVRVSGDPIRYERRLTDGRVEVYGQSDDQQVWPRRVFLTRLRDGAGNELVYDYDSKMRLVTVRDALGQKTKLQYEHQDPLLVTAVRDPFGREARIAYDDQGRLVSIGNAAGLTSSFAYEGETTFIEAMTTPYGTTRFAGGGKTNKRWLEATDPLGQTERLEFRHDAPGVAFSEEDWIAPVGIKVFNAELNLSNSYYWDKTNRARTKDDPDYTQARIRHWLHDKTGLITSPYLGWVKTPLGARVWLSYPGQEYPISAGGIVLDRPETAGRVLSGGGTELMQFAYNPKNRMTKMIDPTGRETVFTYAANGTDMVEIKQKNDGGYEVLMRVTWNDQHRPLSITDIAGQTTRYTYNSRGQLTQASLAEKTTRYEYDDSGYLVRIGDADGRVQTSYGYDDHGRVASLTDSRGSTVNYRYDALDRLIRTSYPDGTAEEIVWDRLDPIKIRDRQGRETRYQYDAMRRLVSRTDSSGKTERYDYDTDGRLVRLTDDAGKITQWQYDLEGRLIGKTHPDGRRETQSWDSAGRLIPAADGTQTAIDKPQAPTPAVDPLIDDSGLMVVREHDTAEGRHLSRWMRKQSRMADTCDGARYAYLACGLDNRVDPGDRWPWCAASMISPGYSQALPTSISKDESSAAEAKPAPVEAALPDRVMTKIKAGVEGKEQGQ